MAVERTAQVDPNGPAVALAVHIGDGVRGAWDARLFDGEAVVAQWKGDGGAGPIRLAVSDLVGARLQVEIVVFGPAVAVGYHADISLKQGRKRVLQDRVAFRGQVAAKSTEHLSAIVRFGMNP